MAVPIMHQSATHHGIVKLEMKYLNGLKGFLRLCSSRTSPRDPGFYARVERVVSCSLKKSSNNKRKACPKGIHRFVYFHFSS